MSLAPSDAPAVPAAREWAADRLTPDRVAWSLALLFFGVGDLFTTVWGFRVGLVEANPFITHAVGQPSFLLLLAGKSLAFVLAAGIWKLANPRPYVVPATLAVGGVLIVGWNSYVLAVVV